MFYRFLFAFGLLIPKIVAAAESGYKNLLDEYSAEIFPDYTPGPALVMDLAMMAGNFFAIPIAGIAVVAILYGAIRIIASAGNDQGKEEGKKIIITAIIGLLLAIAAEAIILWVAAFVSPDAIV